MHRFDGVVQAVHEHLHGEAAHIAHIDTHGGDARDVGFAVINALLVQGLALTEVPAGGKNGQLRQLDISKIHPPVPRIQQLPGAVAGPLEIIRPYGKELIPAAVVHN